MRKKLLLSLATVVLALYSHAQTVIKIANSGCQPVNYIIFADLPTSSPCSASFNSVLYNLAPGATIVMSITPMAGATTIAWATPPTGPARINAVKFYDPSMMGWGDGLVRPGCGPTMFGPEPGCGLHGKVINWDPSSVGIQLY